MKKYFLVSLIIILGSAPFAYPLDSASEQRAAVLYHKHCTACHPDAGRLKPEINIAEFIRKPMATMPVFSSQKISDTDARLLGDYIKLQIYYSQP